MNKKYIQFDPNEGYPIGDDLFYECLHCGEVVPSSPSESTHCECRNIMIDIDYGRIKIQDHSLVKLYCIAVRGNKSEDQISTE